jgi:hypothetical protein
VIEFRIAVLCIVPNFALANLPIVFVPEYSVLSYCLGRQGLVSVYVDPQSHWPNFGPDKNGCHRERGKMKTALFGFIFTRDLILIPRRANLMISTINNTLSSTTTKRTITAEEPALALKRGRTRWYCRTSDDPHRYGNR